MGIEPEGIEEGALLAEYIDKKFDTRQEFADLLGVSKFKVSHWVTGKTRLRGNDRRRVAQVLGISEQQLRAAPISGIPSLTESGIGAKVPVAREGFRVIPVYGTVPAGVPGTNMSDAIDFVEMPDWGGHFQRWGRVVSGDSMAPEFLHGDIVVFEDRRPNLYDVVYATKENEEAFKVYVPNGAEAKLLAPINTSHSAFSAEGWEILGVCIYRERITGHGDVETKRYRNGATWHR